MRPFHYRQHIKVTADQAFDWAVVHQPENHSKWEKEVVAVRRDPLALGARGVMVRREWGKTYEAPFQISELEGRRVVYLSGAGAFSMVIEFAFEPADGGCDVVVKNTLKLSGALRLLTPLFWILHPARCRRISRDFAAAIETHC